MSDSKQDIEVFYKKLLEKGEIKQTNENFSIGKIEQFSLESINNFGRGFIHNGDVYLAHDKSKIHSHSISLLAKQFYEPINKKFNYDFFFASSSKVPIFNLYGGGYCQLLSTDVNIGSAHEDGQNEIIGEVAFINEDFSLLVAKCVANLNEYTQVSYSFGLKIEYDSTNFSAIFFLLERKNESNKEKRLRLKNAVRKNDVSLDEKSSTTSLDEFKEAFFNEDLEKFGVTLKFKRVINEDNLNIPLIFDLKICNYDQRKLEDVSIEIGPDILAEIHELWKEHFLNIKIENLQNNEK